MRILAISGSLRAASSNTAALQAMARLAPDGVTVALYDGMGDLPHFNPDLDPDPDPLVPQALVLRRAVGAADGILISSPEFAHGVPGALKNVLDWLVSSLEFPGKPVALVNCSPSSTHAEAQLIETLSTMSAKIVTGAYVSLPLRGKPRDVASILADEAMAAELRRGIEAFARAITQMA